MYWTPLDPEQSVWTLRYSFGPGLANTFAVKLDDGSFLLVSPPSRCPPEVFTELAKHGPVSALLAPNGFHHMGQGEWRRAFPQAVSYAPDDVIARVSKQTKLEFLPTSALAPKLGSRVELVRPAGYRSTDLLARVHTPSGDVWFGGDLITNFRPGDLKGMVGFIFSVLGGGPGFRVNGATALFFLKNRKAWKAEMKAKMSDHPLLAVMPGHGQVASGETLKQVAQLFD